MKKKHSKVLHISFFIFTFAMSKIKDNKHFKQLKIMATANFGFNAKNVTITSSNINEVYVECENGDIDDVLIDIPNRDIAEYVSDNFDDIMDYIDSDMIIGYLQKNGYAIFDEEQTK